MRKSLAIKFTTWKSPTKRCMAGKSGPCQLYPVDESRRNIFNELWPSEGRSSYFLSMPSRVRSSYVLTIAYRARHLHSLRSQLILVAKTNETDRNRKPTACIERVAEKCLACFLLVPVGLKSCRFLIPKRHGIQIFYTVLSGGIIVQRCTCAVPMQSLFALYLFFVCLYMKRFRVLLSVSPTLPSSSTDPYIR